MNMHPKMTNKDCSLWLSNEEGMLVVKDAFVILRVRAKTCVAKKCLAEH
jgi:hypothetical protein